MTNAIVTLTLALASQNETSGETWIHLLPAGTFSGRDGRGPYHVNDANAIIAASRAHAGRLLIPVDYEHQIDHAAANGRPAPAAGWIKGLQSRPNGIWGLVDWTPAAAEHLAKREYRYLSPAIVHKPDGTVVAILRASLVNNPNFDLLTALASAKDGPMDPKLRADLVALLGLNADADDTAIIEKVRALVEDKTAMQSAKPDLTQYVPIGDFQKAISEVNKLRQGISRHAAEEQVASDIRKAVILPWMKDWAVELCMNSMPSYEKFIQGIGPGFSYLHKKGPGAAPPPDANERRSAIDGGQRAIARNLGLTDEEYIAARGDD